MKHNQNGITSWMIAVVLFVLMVCGLAGWNIYRVNFVKDDTASTAHDPKALMTISGYGGLCSNGLCKHASYDIYEDGRYDDHDTLKVDKLNQLKQIIDTTDFTRLKPAKDPMCPSASDGVDQIFMFPQKYGDREFKPCMLDLKDNGTFTKINALIANQ